MPEDGPQIDAGLVIAALRRQVADLAYRLALTEAQLTAQLTEEVPDGQAN